MKPIFKKFTSLFVFIYLLGNQCWSYDLIFNNQMHYLTNREGLSNNIVTDIIQDYEGFIWIGTQEGLNRFDSYNFKVFKKKLNESTSLSDNEITSLAITPDSSLWVGTRYGLNKFNAANEKFKQYILNPALHNINLANIITAVRTNSKGELFVSNELGQIFYYLSDVDSFKVYGPNFYRIRNFIIDNDSIFWIAHLDGFSYYNSVTDEIIKVTKYNDKSLKSIKALFADGDTIWLGNEKGEIYFFLKKRKILKKLNHNIPNIFFITHICKSRDNKILFSTNKGIIIYSKNDNKFFHIFHQSSNPQGLNTLGISVVYIDYQSNIWIGTYQGGVNVVFAGKNFLNLNKYSSPAIVYDNISAILEDSKGRLWLGSFDFGINIVDLKNNETKVLKPNSYQANSLPYGTIYSIFEDSRNHIWIGNYLSYLLKYNELNGQFTPLVIKTDNKEKPYCIDIRSIVEDKFQNLWFIAHGNGLWKFNPNTGILKQYKYNNINTFNSLADDWAFQVFIDSDDNLWIATPSGLSRFDPIREKFTNYYHQPNDTNSLSSNVIQVIFEDSNGLIWTGTNYGLNVFNKFSNKFYRLYEKDGLPSNNIHAILEHTPGEIWISTNNGLSRIRYKFQLSKLQTIIRNYTVADNIQDSYFLIRSARKLKNGSLIFGGEKGVVIFNPNTIIDNTVKPKIVFTELKVFGQPIKIGDSTHILSESLHKTKEINLPYKYNFFSISYVALNFIASDKNTYAYILEGFDPQWIYVGNNKEATYTDVDPGKYVFRVKAANNDGVWNEEGISIIINILPPFWMTWWFKLVLATIVIISGYVLYTLRIGFLEKQKRILEEKVAERTTQLIKANEELRELNNYVMSQNQEIIAQNIEISNKNEEIYAQKNMLEEQKLRIEQTLKELDNYRNKLEELVEERTRELVIEKERAEESDRLKSSFLANLSHEIRTPLNSIVGFTHLLFEPSIPDAEKAKYKTFIESSSNNLLNIINDIIDFSKLESGHLEIVIQDVHLNDFFTKIQEIFAIILEREKSLNFKDILLKTEVPNQILNMTIRTDKLRLQQIFSNLISNAIKFTEKGYVEIGAKILKNKEMIQFFVKDTGIGIRPEHQKVVFERFRKIEDDKNYLYPGTGLGLAITQRLVMLLGGYIGVESEWQKGSIFYFTIPLICVANNMVKEVSKSKSIPQLAGRTILVAEDDYANFEYICRVLENTKATVLHAVNGQQAVAYMHENPEIELVFMDIKMPEMDGLEAMKQIRGFNNNVPIIALTAYALSDDIRKWITEGFNDYLIKPVSPSDVYKMLKQYIISQNDF